MPQSGNLSERGIVSKIKFKSKQIGFQGSGIRIFSICGGWIGKGGYAIGKVRSPSKMNEDEATEKRGESRAGGEMVVAQIYYDRKREYCYCINVLFARIYGVFYALIMREG